MTTASISVGSTFEVFRSNVGASSVSGSKVDRSRSVRCRRVPPGSAVPVRAVRPEFARLPVDMAPHDPECGKRTAMASPRAQAECWNAASATWVTPCSRKSRMVVKKVVGSQRQGVGGERDEAGSGRHHALLELVSAQRRAAHGCSQSMGWRGPTRPARLPRSTLAG